MCIKWGNVCLERVLSLELVLTVINDGPSLKESGSREVPVSEITRGTQDWQVKGFPACIKLDPETSLFFTSGTDLLSESWLE